MARAGAAPITVKRRRAAAQPEPHHGGAWKVAYADFVTAMMAFFLLMWLLNATTDKQRKGLADYFSPSVPISGVSGGGEGALWGDSVFTEDTMVNSGVPAAWNPHGNEGPGASAATDSAEGRGLQEAQQLLEDLKARGGESMASLLEQRHVVTRLSDEGLVIDIFSLPGQPLFSEGGAQPSPVLVSTLGVVAEVLEIVRNGVAVNAHLPTRPVVVAENPVWDLSGDRAGAARRALEAAGFPAPRVQRVAGFADRQPVTDDPLAIRNGRVEIVVLRRTY